MKMITKIVLLMPLILAACLIVNLAVEVLYARSITIEKAEEYLSASKINVHDLSKEQLDTLIMIQDPGFYDHKGVDFSTPGNGLTTLTQSLAKQFYFTKFRQGLPKIKQTLCARYALHPLVSKEDQITIFLNIIYFGKGQIGIVDAAEYFYKKQVDQLIEDEYISLLACIIMPNTLNVEDHPLKNAERVEKIKRYLSGEYKPMGLFDITYDKECDYE